MVSARSDADTPVEVPSFASIDTHIAVSRREEFSATSSGISSASSRSGVIARHSRPRPCFNMKLIAAGVTFDAAIVKSPSFSRSSSSTTTIISPRRIAAMASSTGENGDLARRAPLARRMLIVQLPRHVLAEDVGLELDAIARARFAERCVIERKWHDLNANARAFERRHRETDAVDRNRALRHDERPQLLRCLDFEPVAVALRGHRGHATDRIDVAEHEVPAESRIRAERTLEIDETPFGHREQRRHTQRFR